MDPLTLVGLGLLAYALTRRGASGSSLSVAPPPPTPSGPAPSATSTGVAPMILPMIAAVAAGPTPAVVPVYAPPAPRVVTPDLTTTILRLAAQKLGGELLKGLSGAVVAGVSAPSVAVASLDGAAPLTLDELSTLTPSELDLLGGGVEADAGAALTTTTEAVDAAPALGLGDLGAGIGTAVSLGLDLSSSMPTDQKLAASALDVANGALIFVPVIGWALAIAGMIAKPLLMSLFATGLTHAQREALEVARVLSTIQPMAASVARASTPTELWQALTHWGSGTFGGVTGVAVEVSYTSSRWGPVTMVGTPMGQPVAGRRVGDPLDLTQADLTTLQVSVQAGVEPSKLAQANAAIALAVTRQVTLFRGAMQGDPTALGVLVHLWHMTRPEVIDIPHGISTSVDVEIPLLGEALRSLYYQDVARQFDFQTWPDLIGWVLQDRWTVYTATTSTPTWPDFMRSLGYASLADLREAIFYGAIPAPQEAETMFAQIANALQAVKQNIDFTLRQGKLNVASSWSDAYGRSYVASQVYRRGDGTLVNVALDEQGASTPAIQPDWIAV